MEDAGISEDFQTMYDYFKAQCEQARFQDQSLTAV